MISTLPGTRRDAKSAGAVMVRDGLSMTVSAALTASVGLVAWIVAARMLPRAEVGRAAAFVSGFMLVASLGDLGLDRALLRWVPRAGEHREALLRRCYAVVLTASFTAALAVLLLPTGAAIRAALGAEPVLGAALFVAASLSWAIFQFQDPVLVSLGRARWVPWENASISVLRVLILALAGPALGAAGILLSWVVPAVGGVLVISLLVRRVLTREQAPVPPEGLSVLPRRREVAALLAPIYPARVSSAIVVYLVPLIVTGRFGSAAGAVFFVGWMAGNTVDYAAIGFAQSVIVRISHEPERAWTLLALGLRRVAALFLPVLAAGALLAPLLLSVFGPAYTALGTDLLRLVLLGCAPRLFTTLLLALNVARGHGWAAGALEAASAASVVSAAVLADTLTGIGIGFALAQLAVAVGAATLLVRFRRRKVTEA
jgi:O-antigen/teichoic acid export membrane protein